MVEENELTKNQKRKKFLETVLARMSAAEVGSSAATIAYYLLLSIFPLIIAVGNILPYLKINAERVLPYIATMLPDSIYTMLEGTIRSLLENSNGGLLSISAIATLWGASRSINALQNSLNKVYGVPRRTNMILTRLFSFGVIFLFLMAVMVLAILFTLGQSILDYILPILSLPESISGLFGTLKWPVTMISLFLTMSVIYSVLPNAKVRLRSILPGAIFSTVGWMALTQFFGLYTKYFSNGLTSYGLIGGFIVFMLWLDFAATVIILGGVINAVCEEYFNGGIEARERRIPAKLSQLITDKQQKKEEVEDDD